MPATARPLSVEQSAEVLQRYQLADPKACRQLRSSIESATGRPVDELPMVQLELAAG